MSFDDDDTKVFFGCAAIFVILLFVGACLIVKAIFF
jgi:hypothetical protein